MNMRGKLAAALASTAVAVPLSLFIGMGSASATCTYVCGGGGGSGAGLTHALTALVNNPNTGVGISGGDPDEGGQLAIIAVLIGL